MPKKQSVKHRLLAWVYLDEKTGCWVCERCKDRSGYAFMNEYSLKENFAHRVSYILFNGPIPKGLKVLHKCDNPSCVNPEHLFLGTAKDNYEDSRKKGRNCKGEKNGLSKLKEEEVIVIRYKRNIEGKKLQEIADEFGITFGQVSAIATGRQWKHLLAS